MKDDEIQLIDMVEQRNSFEKQALDTIAKNEALEVENKALKEVNSALRAINISVAKKAAEGRCDLVWLTRDDLQEYSDIEQAGGINGVRLSTMRDLAILRCPASGFVITNEKSRMEILDWANFEESCNT